MAPDREESRWLRALQTSVDPSWRVDRVEAFSPASIDVIAIAPPLRTPLATFPNLVFIQSLWAGVEAVLSDSGLRTDVPLARMKDEAMETSMKLSILSHVLAFHLHHDIYIRQQQRSEWSQIYGVEPADRKITFLGLGAMATPAGRSLVELGFDVAALVRRPDLRTSSLDTDPALFGVPALDERLAESDVVVNVLPVTSRTENLIDSDLLSKMAEGSALINVARGVHVVEHDLLTALDSGRLRHAFLDVFRTEPLPPDHPFWTHDRITITPHMAAPTFPSSGAKFVAAQLERLARGVELEHLVDHEAGY